VKIGIVCYASVGGSGVVATQLAHALVQRGHRVHLISSEPPFRWRDGVPDLVFERVEMLSYPLFREPQYLLALSTTIARVACDHRLDLVHAHYAVPHATAAYLADRMLEDESDACQPRTVTTLHGTDITLVGSDPSYRRVVAFSIEQSHAVTAVSESLKRDTARAVGVRKSIDVVPNFLDCSEYARLASTPLRSALSPDGLPIVLHVSNFRPVKRVDAVVDVFARAHRETRARLVMVGDGPDREPLVQRVAASGLAEYVTFAGEQNDLVPWLSSADVFLLPSREESFGLAALEAMACEVPVVVSRVGGLPEVIADGETGFLCDADDLDGMASRLVDLLQHRDLRARIGRAAAAHVRAHYCVDAVVPMYERIYDKVLKTDTGY
jgi:N-acetyl-alpha-D-glucosaminyl L-malate synthase BshA